MEDETRPQPSAVTFRQINGFSFSLAKPDGTYHVFEEGVLATDTTDPALPGLMAWAEQRADISVVIDGEERQAGMLVCDECGRLIDDRNEEKPGEAQAEHARHYHTDPSDEGQQVAVRRTRGRRKG